jgi:histidinol phosphatase-like enzyme (inositol monophosphatase family)
MTRPGATDLRSRLEIAVAAAREAGDLTLGYFQRPDLAVDTKADSSPVTVADREAERLLRGRLSACFPADGIVGEEHGESRGRNDCRWWLDPIDGTQSFVRGVPLYGTMLGLEVGDDTVLGVVYFPALAELCYATKGMGAWWVPRLPSFAEHPTFPSSPRRAHVSATRRLDGARFNTTSVMTWATAGLRDAYDRLLEQVASDRTWGDCYGHALVATGRADIMVDPVLNDWDCAALKPIIEEAGGRFTDLSGSPTIHGRSGVSTNGRLHDEVLRIIATSRG